MFTEMFKIAASNELEYPSQTDLGKVEHYPDAIKDHIDAVLALPCIDTNLVAARKLKVCLDTVNGMILPTIPSSHSSI